MLILWLCGLMVPSVKAQEEPATTMTRTVSVLAPGAEPHRKIRYAPPLGSVFTVKVAFNISIGREVGGKREEPMHSPEVVLTMRVTVVDFPDTGGVAYESEVTDVDETMRTGCTKKVLDQTREHFSKLKGQKFPFSIGPRGQLYTGCTMLPQVEAPVDDLNAWFINREVWFVNSMHHFLLQFLPTEGVGPGARWKTMEPWDTGPKAYLRETETVWLAGDKGEPRLKSTISAKWKSPVPVVPMDEHLIEDTGLKLTGTAMSTLAAASPFPTELDFKSVYETTGVAKGKGGATVATKFVDTVSIRATSKAEAAKPKGAK